MTDAALLVALANAQADRRPTHAPVAVPHDALADAASASELLKPFLDAPVDTQELAAVRAVQRAVVGIIDALIDSSQPPLEALNALAAREPVIYVVERQPDGTLRATPRPKRASAAGTLLLAVFRELSELEPSRLRRCARPECTLVFYDLTRSATQRWHAVRPLRATRTATTSPSQACRLTGAHTPIMITRLWRGFPGLPRRGHPAPFGARRGRRHHAHALRLGRRHPSFRGDDCETPVLEPKAPALLAHYERRAHWRLSGRR